MLPHVIRYNARSMEADYSRLAALAAETTPSLDAHNSQTLATFISDLVQQAGLATDLQSQGVEQDMLTRLAEDADKQWTKQFNPRTVETEDLLSLYRQAF